MEALDRLDEDIVVHVAKYACFARHCYFSPGADSTLRSASSRPRAARPAVVNLLYIGA